MMPMLKFVKSLPVALHVVWLFGLTSSLNNGPLKDALFNMKNMPAFSSIEKGDVFTGSLKRIEMDSSDTARVTFTVKAGPPAAVIKGKDSACHDCSVLTRLFISQDLRKVHVDHNGEKNGVTSGNLRDVIKGPLKTALDRMKMENNGEFASITRNGDFFTGKLLDYQLGGPQNVVMFKFAVEAVKPNDKAIPLTGVEATTRFTVDDANKVAIFDYLGNANAGEITNLAEFRKHV